MAGGSGTEDLNLIPYMDVMVNLIMFMLVLVAVLVEFKETPVLAPSYCDGCGGGKGEQIPFVTVAVTREGYKLLGGGDAEGGVEIPKAGGRYDTRALTRNLKQLKVQIPKLSDNLVLMADGGVKYEDIIATMDAARFDGTPDRPPLFNGITFAKLVE